MVFGICLGLIAVVIVLLCSNISIKGTGIINLHKQTLEIEVYFYRICLFRRSIDLLDEKSDETYSLQEILSMLHKASRDLPSKISEFNRISTIILNRFRFKKCLWHTSIGTGDAQTTGIAAGGLWGVKGTLIGLVVSKSQWQCQPSLNVTPCFNQKQLYSVIDCMISIRLGQAIYAILKIIWLLPAKRKAAF